MVVAGIPIVVGLLTLMPQATHATSSRVTGIYQFPDQASVGLIVGHTNIHRCPDKVKPLRTWTKMVKGKSIRCTTAGIGKNPTKIRVSFNLNTRTKVFVIKVSAGGTW